MKQNKLSYLIILFIITTKTFSDATAYILADVANIRMSPDAKSEIVARFLINTKVTIGSVDGEWRKISVGNITGWIHNTLLSKKSFTSSEVTIQVVS